ncbi:uncharacterized protein G2W53_033352 [Senna tora]|uniref:Uncharacterized protein n=1 Tax=Senna tora TaxID=362788 RepID=A0A834WAX4_9FABA|nr:uncharacterized protein G2W53_033352 [Senna tora]
MNKGAVTLYHGAHDFANDNKEGICTQLSMYSEDWIFRGAEPTTLSVVGLLK